ncbi:hypothetical protein D3C80_743530 [compost metagenome]
MNYSFTRGMPGVYDIGVLQSFVNNLPTDEEQHHSMVVLLNLKNLNGYVNDYASAIGLRRYAQTLREEVLRTVPSGTLDFTNQMHMLKNWDEMAGREASMTVYHVGKTIEQIRGNLRFTETIAADADVTILRRAASELNRAFPDYDIARNAAGHRAEAFASLDRMKSNAIEVEDGQKLLIGNMEGDKYVTTFKKKLLKVPLNEEARQRLNSVVALIYSAFPKIVNMLPPLNFGVPVNEVAETTPEKP